MSFSKAKIQRFNDLKDCTPSPANYNVATQEKIKLGIISAPGTYSKKCKSPPLSDSGSVHSTPCFQTPTLPLKKKKFLSFRAKPTYQEELREKTVECSNKDLYIKDLNEQVENMTEKIHNLKQENAKLKSEFEGASEAWNKRNKEESLKRTKEYNYISHNVKEVNNELRHIKQKSEDLKNKNLVELSKLYDHLKKLQTLYNKSVEESREELVRVSQEFAKKEENLHAEYSKQIDVLTNSHHKQVEEIQAHFLILIEQLEEKEESIRAKHADEIDLLKSSHRKEIEEIQKNLEDSEAKVRLLEENFKDVNLLTELQMNEKIEEIELNWKQKFEDKEKEHEAILKECQAISEYSIIQSEVEKNHIKKMLEDKEKEFEELVAKRSNFEEEVNNLKTEKHAYELSINTFRDTIEVLKKRLIDSDRDVEQLKEELEKNEEKILNYEKKFTELSNQLSEAQLAYEEVEMQYESTSKILESQVKSIEKDLLQKVELLQREAKDLAKNKELLNQVLEQYHEQQALTAEAQDTIAQSKFVVESLEKKQVELEAEVKECKLKLDEEMEEAAEIRKKYIEKSGKYDKLAQQFEQLLQELDKAKFRIQELENFIGPYQQQLESYQQELKLLNEEKHTIENEAKELSLKYAEILGHQNHSQKIKHVWDLKMKSSELFQKNIDLESRNQKLNLLVEKLLKEIDDLKKPGKKIKAIGDKENLGSPKCVKSVQSPGPLKDKN